MERLSTRFAMSLLAFVLFCALGNQCVQAMQGLHSNTCELLPSTVEPHHSLIKSSETDKIVDFRLAISLAPACDLTASLVPLPARYSKCLVNDVPLLSLGTLQTTEVRLQI